MESLTASSSSDLRGRPLDKIHPSEIGDLLKAETSRQASGTILPSQLRQLRWTMIICFLTVPLSVLLFLNFTAALVSNDPPLGSFLFSASLTLLVVTILSQSLAVVIRLLFSCVFETFRWQLAARRRGVSVATFLALSGGTSSLGVWRLLGAAGRRSHTLWCLARYIYSDISHLQATASSPVHPRRRHPQRFIQRSLSNGR